MTPMKSLLCLTATILGLHFASAQDEVKPVPLEEAQKAARHVVDSAGTISDLPVKFEADFAKPSALHAGKAGIMVIPDVNFTTNALAKANDKPLSVGQLWMIGGAVAKEHKVLPNAKLRLVTVRQNDKDARVQLYHLALSKSEKDGLQLSVYGSGEEPVLRVPLKSIVKEQDLPLELKGAKQDEETGLLTISLLGKYSAELTLMKQEE